MSLSIDASPDASPRPQHLLRTADLDGKMLLHLLDVAMEIKTHPSQGAHVLAGKSVVLYFDKPSTRTRISMETAVHRLGGLPITVRPTELQLGKGETIEDTARVISSYAAAFVIRTFANDEVERFAAAATIPVINALTDTHHPCQSLADLLTLREHFGRLHGLKVAYVGDGNNNVAHSLIEAAALVGIEMRVASPPSYEPIQEVIDWARETASRAGGDLQLTHDPIEAVEGADAVYTDLWVSLGNADHERLARSKSLRQYQVDDALMGHADAHAVFMHCLPANRNEEVTASVIDGPQSVVFQQAANRLPTAQAVLTSFVSPKATVD